MDGAMVVTITVIAVFAVIFVAGVICAMAMRLGKGSSKGDEDASTRPQPKADGSVIYYSHVTPDELVSNFQQDVEGLRRRVRSWHPRGGKATAAYEPKPAELARALREAVDAELPGCILCFFDPVSQSSVELDLERFVDDPIQLARTATIPLIALPMDAVREHQLRRAQMLGLSVEDITRRDREHAALTVPDANGGGDPVATAALAASRSLRSEEDGGGRASSPPPARAKTPPPSAAGRRQPRRTPSPAPKDDGAAAAANPTTPPTARKLARGVVRPTGQRPGTPPGAKMPGSRGQTPDTLEGTLPASARRSPSAPPSDVDRTAPGASRSSTPMHPPSSRGASPGGGLPRGPGSRRGSTDPGGFVPSALEEGDEDMSAGDDVAPPVKPQPQQRRTPVGSRGGSPAPPRSDGAATPTRRPPSAHSSRAASRSPTPTRASPSRSVMVDESTSPIKGRGRRGHPGELGRDVLDPPSRRLVLVRPRVYPSRGRITTLTPTCPVAVRYVRPETHELAALPHEAIELLDEAYLRWAGWVSDREPALVEGHHVRPSRSIVHSAQSRHHRDPMASLTRRDGTDDGGPLVVVTLSGFTVHVLPADQAIAGLPDNHGLMVALVTGPDGLEVTVAAVPARMRACWTADKAWHEVEHALLLEPGRWCLVVEASDYPGESSGRKPMVASRVYNVEAQNDFADV